MGPEKSTTMRLVLGLDAPTAGDVTVNGKHYRDHAAPLHEVGALLEARLVHTGRSASNHLLALARTHGIPRRRVEELIDLVGLREVAKKRAGKFSLGMGQRATSRCTGSRLGRSATAPLQTGSLCTSSRPSKVSLEEAFMNLTREDVEFQAAHLEVEREEAVA